MKFSAKNPRLRKAAKRCTQYYQKTPHMKRILSVILFLPILTFSQITVKSQEINEEKVVAKTDFSQNFTQ